MSFLFSIELFDSALKQSEGEVPIEKLLYRDLGSSDVGNEVPTKSTKFYQSMEQYDEN